MIQTRRLSTISKLVPVVLIAGFLSAWAPPAASGAPPADDTPVLLTPKGEHEDGSDEATFDKLRDAYYWSRLLSGDDPISLTEAATMRTNAAGSAARIASESQRGAARGGTWTSQGPDPIVQNGRTTNAFQAVSGRIGALVIRPDGTIILGAAQGGVWTYDTGSGTWVSRMKDSDTQAVGALALAPSNSNIVYMGSGEGALSGDSYYGDGIYRSQDGGLSWKHVSRLFTGQAVTDLVVDPQRPNHLFASTVRGRGGNHRTTHPTAVPYGVWESTNGGVSWTLRKGTTNEIHGATDLVMDPQNAKVLWASFWGDGIYRSTDGGLTWASALGDLPAGNFLEGGTRFSLGLAHPTGSATTTVYTGFDYFDSSDTYHPARVYKSTDNGVHWTATATGTGIDSIVNYCGTQCFYDNEVKPDPTNPDVVYVLGSYGYSNSPQSGGIYRSKDGGQTWQNLGNDLHPDFHAIAFQPNDTAHIAIGKRRRRMAVTRPRWAQRPRRSPVRGGLGGPERPDRPGDRGVGALDRTGDHPVHVDGYRAQHPRPVLGWHPGQRNPAQVAREQPVVRPGQRRRWPGDRRPDHPEHPEPGRARIRLRYLLRHFAIPL
jgi:photosystem II stability/assembly factor-like uncharacterized protein